MTVSALIQRHRASGTKLTSIVLAAALVAQFVLGSFVQAAGDTAVSTESFSDNSGISYSEVGGQPTGEGDFGNGAVAGYPEGACIPFFVELKNTTKGQSASELDISITLVHDYNNSGVIGVTQLEQVAQISGTLQDLPDADNLNDIAFSGIEVTSVTSVALASGGSATAAVSGPYAGDEGDGTSPVTATDTQRHYLVTVQDVPSGDSAYVFFCGRLGLDASEYPGASLSIGVSPPSGGVENTAIATNQVLALPSITLTKEVVGGEDPASAWSFNVSPSINGQSNFLTTPVDADTASVTIENVSPDGAFSITESGPAGYPFTAGSGSNCVFSGSTATASVAAGDPATNATCVFTNTFDDTPPPPTTGTLTIQKEIVNDNGGQATTDDFSFFLYEAPGQVVDVQSGVEVQLGDANVLAPGTYWVSESGSGGYYQASFAGACDGSPFVTLAAGENLTCTITNDDQPATLTVIKNVINNDGGILEAGAFTMNVSGTSVSDASFPGAADAGTTVTLDAGAYSVTEEAVSGYAVSYSEDCIGSLLPGGSATCTVTNDDIAPTEEEPTTGTLIVIKSVINDDAGESSASAFTLNVSGTNPSQTSFSGEATPGTSVTLEPGEYSVTESPAAGYAVSYSEDCTGSIAAGQTKTCIVTNDDNDPPAPTTATLTVIKIVVGSQAAPSSFTLNVSGGNASPASFPGNGTGTEVTIDIGAAYSVTEDAATGYTTTFSEGCNGEMPAQGATCTVTNTFIVIDEPTQGTLTVVKVVINDDGGSSQVSDFPLYIGEMSVTSGTPNSLPAGQYVVGETGSADYVASFSGDCDANGVVSLEDGDQKTCTITNDDKDQGGGGSNPFGTLIVVTKVINDDGGVAIPSMFLMTVGDGISTTSTFSGFDTPGFSMGYLPGAYVVNGSANAAYDKTMGPNCSGTMTAGLTITCVVTYDDRPTGGSPTPPEEPPAPQPEPEAPPAPPAPVPQVLGATDSDLPVTGIPGWALAAFLLAVAPLARRKQA